MSTSAHTTSVAHAVISSCIIAHIKTGPVFLQYSRKNKTLTNVQSTAMFLQQYKIRQTAEMYT